MTTTKDPPWSREGYGGGRLRRRIGGQADREGSGGAGAAFVGKIDVTGLVPGDMSDLGSKSRWDRRVESTAKVTETSISIVKEPLTSNGPGLSRHGHSTPITF
jgi:hypothetical protein